MSDALNIVMAETARQEKLRTKLGPEVMRDAERLAMFGELLQVADELHRELSMTITTKYSPAADVLRKAGPILSHAWTLK